MDSTEWYQQWFNSPFYHKLYFNRDEKEAEKMIFGLLRHLQPLPHSRLLDVGCGKGRHSKIMADAGFEVTGIDLAPENIRLAQQLQNPRLHFYQHDMRLPFWVNYFDYAFNFFTSFGYFKTRREHDAAMRTIATSLKPSGQVMFDYLNVHFVEERLVHNEVKSLDETTYEIHRWHDDNHFFKRIIITDPSLEKPLEYTEKVAKFNLGDFTDMLAYHKMQVTEVYGDYNFSAYHISKTPRMIIFAKKGA